MGLKVPQFNWCQTDGKSNDLHVSEMYVLSYSLTTKIILRYSLVEGKYNSIKVFD